MVGIKIIKDLSEAINPKTLYLKQIGDKFEIYFTDDEGKLLKYLDNTCSPDTLQRISKLENEVFKPIVVEVEIEDEE